MSRERAIVAAGVRTYREPRPVSRRWKNVSGLGVGTGVFLLVYYIVIFVVPFGTAIWLSFQNWDFIVDPTFVKLRNYEHAITDDYFWKAFRVTVLFSVTEIAIAVVLALLVALGVSQLGSKLQRFYLALFYLPVVVPSIVEILL